MNNPLQDCILVMRRAIQQYIQENQIRDAQTVSCFQLRSFVRQGRDTAIAASKLRLAEQMDFTLGTVNKNYEAIVSSLGEQLNNKHIRPDQSASLAYDGLMVGFARLKDCLEAGKVTEDKINGWSARGGKLAQTFTLCEGHIDAYWAQAKDSVWSTKELHGIKFEYNDEVKPTVFAHFDKVMNMNRGLFTAILEIQEPNTQQNDNQAPPPYEKPAPYVPDTQIVEINLVSKKVTIKNN